MNETPEATTMTEAPVTDAAITATAEQQPAPEQPPAAPDSPWAGFMMPLLLIAIFYFMFLRPQQRKEKERRNMIETLRAGAKVVFAGGIIGTIVEASEKSFMVETADGSRMEVLRNCVQGVVEPAAPAEK